MTVTPIVLLNAQIHVGAIDLTGTANKVMLVDTVDVKDATTFGSNGMREHQGGIQSVQADHEGFLATPNPDKTLLNSLGVAAQVVTIASASLGSDGLPAAAYAFQGAEASYAPFNSPVGEMAAITGTIMSDSPAGLVRGVLALPRATVAGNTNGLGSHRGAVTGGENVYMAVHVFAAGTTATVRVQSSVDNTFAAPTNRGSVVVTAVGGTWMVPIPATITDTWWRVRVDGVTGSFDLAVFLGVQ